MGRGNSRGRGGRGGGGDRDSGDRNRADERGPPSNRGKDKDERGGRGGPSKNSMRGMSYIHPSTPSFLSAFKAQLTGGPAPDAEGKYDPSAQQAVDAGGRAALPGGRGDRQTSEDREKDDRERERDEDEWGFGEGEEAPQVVVVKEGRHLTQLDMDNERRRAKGLPPLSLDSPSSSKPDPSSAASTSKPPPKAAASSTTTGTGTTKTAKRKAVVVGGDGAAAAGVEKPKKAKKEKKGLLSFDEEEG